MFKRYLPKEVTLMLMWKTYMFNHNGALKKNRNNIPNELVIRISI
jgi:hypothetical protein